MRSSCNRMDWWIDLPKLTSFVTPRQSDVFQHAYHITLESSSLHSFWPQRHSIAFFSHWSCLSTEGRLFHYRESLSSPYITTRYRRLCFSSSLSFLFHMPFLIRQSCLQPIKWALNSSVYPPSCRKQPYASISMNHKNYPTQHPHPLHILHNTIHLPLPQTQATTQIRPISVNPFIQKTGTTRRRWRVSYRQWNTTGFRITIAKEVGDWARVEH